MKKVKLFVLKHQLWFKFGAIALLITMIFLPYTYIVLPVVNEIHTFSVYYYLTMLTDNLSSVFVAAFAFSVCICIIAAFIIVLLLISVLKKSNKYTLFISLITYIVLFFFYLFLLFISIYAWGPYTYDATSIPHIAFYIALLLLAADVACIILLRKKQPRRQTKSEKIAELERRIEELEKRKGGE